MSHIIASPFGFGLPYSSLFTIPSSQDSRRRAARPSEYFWQRAIAANASDHSSDSNWLDVDAPPITDDEQDNSFAPRPNSVKQTKSKRFSKLRHIAFRSFVPNPGSHKNSTVVSTEILSKQTTRSDKFGASNKDSGPLTIFQSWKIKSRGAKTEVKKLVAVVRRHRISSKSPVEQQPKTWEEYHRMYAHEHIDILAPPLPPTEQAPEGAPPTPFHARLYLPPRPANEDVRQLVVNRLGLFGKGPFDSGDEAAARAKARIELGDQLEERGEAPRSLDMSWDHRSSSSSQGTHFGVEETQAMMKGVRTGQLPPETLEQHPVFRRIVKQCRELFGTSISMLTVMDEDRQIFLAESGLGGMREVSRDVTFCAHTILSGRKGFTILDTHKDWRFENGPLVQNFGSRFYAGVPLMAPNLDGSSESEDNACPLGTLCVVDDKPRESFGVADRKKLVYMAEYARREIEKWFLKKMEQKMKALEASQEYWTDQVQSVDSVEGEEETVAPKVLSGDQEHSGPESFSNTYHSLAKKRPGFGRFKSSASIASTPPTSPSSHGNLSLKSPGPVAGPTLFDDISAAIKPKTQKVFDLATKLVGDTLDLSLVYLIAVVPQGDSEELGRTMIISGYNIPLPVPVFDAGLHLRALRAPEGGLLYQNPSVQQSRQQSLNPKLPGNGSETEHQLTVNEPYSSAMLVTVGKEPDPRAGGGFVLAGFTSDTKRVFGGEDISYMKQFAHELAKYTAKLKLL